MPDGSLDVVNKSNAAAPSPAAGPGGDRAISNHGGPLTRRWTEQRWLLDNTIRSVGMDWDQPRSIYLSAPCGPEANADFAAIRQRITKLADASPAFEAVARRREAKAQAAEQSQDFVTARESYFMASIHWGAAQWPIDENNERNHFYNRRKRECYTKYAAHADHHVEAAWVPLPGGQRLPAWFHLPPGYRGGRVPVVISLPGMDSFKEMGVAMYGDRWLSRGMAVLANYVEVPLLYFILHLLTSFGVLIATYWLGRTIFKDRLAGAVAALLLFAGHQRALAGDEMYSMGFTHTWAVFPLAIIAMVFLYREWYFAAFVLAGIIFNLHALTGAYLAVMFGFWALIESRTL